MSTAPFTGIGVKPTVIGDERLKVNVFKITFSESMDTTTLTDFANYSIDGSATISRIDIAPNSNNSAVKITLGNFSAETTYNLTITGVKDLAGNTID